MSKNAFLLLKNGPKDEKGSSTTKRPRKKMKPIRFSESREKTVHNHSDSFFWEKNSHFGLYVTTSKKQQQQLKFSFCTLSQAEAFWGREVKFTNLKENEKNNFGRTRLFFCKLYLGGTTKVRFFKLKSLHPKQK